MFSCVVYAHVSKRPASGSEGTHSQPVEDVVAICLGRLLEHLQVLEHLPLHRELVVEANAIFAQKVEDDRVGLAERDMLKLERAAADRLSLVVGILLVAGSQRELVNQVHGCGALPVRHDIALHLLVVIGTDPGDVLLELAGLLKLLEVGLALDSTVGGQHDVLVVAVDVLLPHGKPGGLVVVLDRLPSMTLGRLGHLGVLADVDGDLLGQDALLDSSRLGMLATATEEAGRFDAGVAYLFFPPIPLAVQKWRLDLVSLSLFGLLLGRWSRLLGITNALVVLKDLGEVELAELLDVDLLTIVGLGTSCVLEVLLEIVKKVLLEHRILHVLGRVEHGAKKGGHLLRINVQVDRLSIIQEPDVLWQGFVRRREDDAIVFQCCPLDAVILLLGGVPPSELSLLFLVALVLGGLLFELGSLLDSSDLSFGGSGGRLLALLGKWGVVRIGFFLLGTIGLLGRCGTVGLALLGLSKRLVIRRFVFDGLFRGRLGRRLFGFGGGRSGSLGLFGGVLFNIGLGLSELGPDGLVV